MWFAKAAQQGYARAQMLMGECFENGYGVEKDAAKALELYRAAHEQHYPDGTCALGLCCELGQGVEQNKALAVEL